MCLSWDEGYKMRNIFTESRKGMFRIRLLKHILPKTIWCFINSQWEPWWSNNIYFSCSESESLWRQMEHLACRGDRIIVIADRASAWDWVIVLSQYYNIWVSCGSICSIYAEHMCFIHFMLCGNATTVKFRFTHWEWCSTFQGNQEPYCEDSAEYIQTEVQSTLRYNRISLLRSIYVVKL